MLGTKIDKSIILLFNKFLVSVVVSFTAICCGKGYSLLSYKDGNGNSNLKIIKKKGKIIGCIENNTIYDKNHNLIGWAKDKDVKSIDGKFIKTLFNGTLLAYFSKSYPGEDGSSLNRYIYIFNNGIKFKNHRFVIPDNNKLKKNMRLDDAIKLQCINIIGNFQIRLKNLVHNLKLNCDCSIDNFNISHLKQNLPKKISNQLENKSKDDFSLAYKYIICSDNDNIIDIILGDKKPVFDIMFNEDVVNVKVLIGQGIVVKGGRKLEKEEKHHIKIIKGTKWEDVKGEFFKVLKRSHGIRESEDYYDFYINNVLVENNQSDDDPTICLNDACIRIVKKNILAKNDDKINKSNNNSESNGGNEQDQQRNNAIISSNRNSNFQQDHKNNNSNSNSESGGIIQTQQHSNKNILAKNDDKINKSNNNSESNGGNEQDQEHNNAIISSNRNSNFQQDHKNNNSNSNSESGGIIQTQQHSNNRSRNGSDRDNKQTLNKGDFIEDNSKIIAALSFFGFISLGVIIGLCQNYEPSSENKTLKESPFTNQKTKIKTTKAIIGKIKAKEKKRLKRKVRMRRTINNHNKKIKRRN